MYKRILLFGLLVLLLASPWSGSAAWAQGPSVQHSDPYWQATYWNNTSLSGSPVLQRSESNLDYNWGMGAIIEGEGLAELTVQNVAGPIGVKGEIKNIATNPAMNVEYTVTITGGILGKVNKVVTGTVTELAAGAIEAFNSGIFFGIGKITIAVEATADNALDAAANFEGTVIGPFVIGIK